MSEIDAETKHRHVVNAAEAREQASEGKYGFLRSEFRKVKGGEEFEIPHKDLLDPDQQDRWDDLQDEISEYDRDPDITAKDGTLIAKGQLITPHKKGGVRVKPSWSERLGIVLWGVEGAARFRANGGNFNEIEVIWSKQDLEMKARLSADPKSGAGDSGVASASN